MNKGWKNLSRNAKISCFSDFFFNLGRTLPHSILTIFLLKSGYSLLHIAITQSIFLGVCFIFEYPSGAIADKFSKKNIYILSIILIAISYLLIGSLYNNFAILCISYALYGLSTALKSGTLDSAVIIELDDSKRIKSYTVILNIFISVSSIIGGFVGGVLFSFIDEIIYFIALPLFLIAVILTIFCKFTYEKTPDKKRFNLFKQIKQSFLITSKSKSVLIPLLLSSIASFMIMPFYTYWQALYSEKNVPEIFFGLLYVVFQVATILGTLLYRFIKLTNKKIIVLLLLIPIIFGASCLNDYSKMAILPIVIVIFSIYSIFLNVIFKQNVPKDYISSITSLSSTSDNVFGVISLFVMSLFTNIFNIEISFLFIFSIFSIISLIIVIIGRKELNPQNELLIKEE